MLDPAREAAEFAVAAFERRIDAAIGEPARRAIGRYAAVLVIGLPVALIAGTVLDGGHVRWTWPTTWGLLAGIALVALVDVLRVIAGRRGADRSGRNGPRSRRERR
jgi:hypothetical protein